MIITIDGPAGAGKSTVAREVAKALGIAYLDTGATYRAVTLKALRDGVDMEDELVLVRLARETNLMLVPSAEGLGVVMNGRDVSRQIRSAEVSEKSHYVARLPAARQVLADLQRRIGANLGDFVTEGRDQGSVVFPEAEFKFYLDATPEMRARRRYDESIAGGQNVEYEGVLQGIIERDARDRTRAAAPLVKPRGAIEIDTSEMAVAQVVAEVLRHVEAKQ